MDSSKDDSKNNTNQQAQNNDNEQKNMDTMLAFSLVFDTLAYSVLRTCSLVSKDFHKTTKEVFKTRYNRHINSYPPSIVDGQYDSELCKVFYVPAKIKLFTNDNNTNNNNNNSNTPHNTDGYVRMWWRGYATSKQYRRMHMDLLNAVKIYGVSAVLIDAYESKIIGIDDQAWIASEWFGALKTLPITVTRLAVLNSKYLFSRAGIENIYNKTKHYWGKNANGKTSFKLKHFDTFEEAEAFLLS